MQSIELGGDDTMETGEDQGDNMGEKFIKNFYPTHDVKGFEENEGVNQLVYGGFHDPLKDL